MGAFAAQLGAAYPELCALGSIGESRQGRAIHALTIAAPGGPAPKPVYLVYGCIHASELSGIHASGVPDMDSTTPGKAQHADPYVVFQVLVGGQVFSAARTKHVLNAANPVWDDTLELPLPEPAGLAAPLPLVLRLRLMDKDFSTADDPIAHAEVELRGVRGPVDVMAERRRGQGPSI